MFEELGELEEVRALTRKKLLADALQKAMKAQKVTPAEMARRMGTSRPTVYRLLDPPSGVRRWTLSNARRSRWGRISKSGSCRARPKARRQAGRRAA